jgi:16S rRNA (uracil1498-N3)-methyltransferase
MVRLASLAHHAMHRFYSTNVSISSRAVSIDDPDELHHLKSVLRLKLGDEVEFVNGQGLLARGILNLLTKTRAEAKIDRVETFSRKTGPRIVLACALPKKAKFEYILEKVTELGVDEIVPLVTERTEVVVGKTKAERKDQRFFRVVLNACKQSRRVWFPEIHPVMTFTDALKTFAGESNALFIPWLGGERSSLKKVFEDTSWMDVAKVVFFIGPEGDFTPQEVALAVKSGAVPLDLGEMVLKVDTAAVAVVAYAKFIFSER